MNFRIFSGFPLFICNFEAVFFSYLLNNMKSSSCNFRILLVCDDHRTPVPRLLRPNYMPYTDPNTNPRTPDRDDPRTPGRDDPRTPDRDDPRTPGPDV